MAGVLSRFSFATAAEKQLKQRKQCKKHCFLVVGLEKVVFSGVVFSPAGSCNFVSLKKIYSCLFIPNCTRNHVITYTNVFMSTTHLSDDSFYKFAEHPKATPAEYFKY